MDRTRPIFNRLTEQACEQMQVMRSEEGARLHDEIVEHARVIREQLEQIEVRAPRVVEDYQSRLQTRVNELLARAELKVEQHDLIREVAVFADKADIREETSRLTAHLDQLESLISEQRPEPVGRTLEFLAQELLREANTIASKSNDAEISKATVVVKSAIDRIKEQAQNVE